MRTKVAMLVSALAVVLALVLPVQAAPELVRYIGGFVANENSFVRNGYDIIMYSDDRASRTIELEGSAGDIEFVGVPREIPTSLTITGTQTITPAAGVITVAPATVLTLTLSAGNAETGDWLLIHNSVTTITTIVDTTATQGGGDITLGQDDMARFIYLHNKWIEAFSPDNS